MAEIKEGMMEEVLEELYELLDLYFRIEIGSGIVRTDEDISRIEPSLDREIFREGILEKIIAKSQELQSL